jgi:DNA-binding PadR family transcriptional regulator
MTEAATHFLPRARTLDKGERICRAVRDVVVLSLLDWEQLYGAELASEYEHITGEFTNPSSLYATLRRLREKAWLVSYESKTPAGYWCLRHKLTPKGRGVLNQFRKFIIGV